MARWPLRFSKSFRKHGGDVHGTSRLVKLEAQRERTVARYKNSSSNLANIKQAVNLLLGVQTTLYRNPTGIPNATEIEI